MFHDTMGETAQIRLSMFFKTLKTFEIECGNSTPDLVLATSNLVETAFSYPALPPPNTAPTM